MIRRLQPKLEQVQGIHLYMSPVQNITVDDRVSRAQFQYALEDPSSAELTEWTNKFVAKLQQLPQLESVATDQQPGGLALAMNIDRVTASRLGIAPTTIDNTLYDAFGQRQINTMYTQTNQYHVILEVDPFFRQTPERLNALYIAPNASSGATGAGAATSFSASGSSSAGSNALTGTAQYTAAAKTLTAPTNALKIANTTASTISAGSSALNSQVPLSAFAHFTTTTELLSINHQGQFPAITVSFNLAPRAALGDAIDAVEKVKADLHMPASLQAGFEGTAASFKASLSNEPLLILAALVTVYIVLGVLYESFIHPITILSTLPSAGVGAFIALMLFHQDLSVVAIIGLVLLIGIVKKNGIMIVDFALQAERERGKNAVDAVYEACLLRFRPIMMTTMAALLGGVPLALGTGFGSELRRPLGIAMVGGLIFSQILTLYTTPVIYIFLRQPLQTLHAQARRRAGSPRGSATPGSAPARRSPGETRPRVNLSAPMLLPALILHPSSFILSASVNLSAPFIRRPVATTLITVGIALAGAVAYYALPVSPLPQVDFPTISVGAEPAGSQRGDHGLVGGHAAGTAVGPHRGRDGDDQRPARSARRASRYSSTSTRNIDGAARDVEAAINAARTYLPTNLPGNPTYRKVNPADAPIMILSLTSAKFDPAKLYDEASTVIQQKLSQINGVGQVTTGGGALPSPCGWMSTRRSSPATAWA